MKKLVLSFWVFMCLTFTVIGQAPNAFKYQAIARTIGGSIIANQNIALRISILQGSPAGTSVYCETHNVTSNGFGMMNLEIGNGLYVSGNFTNINWGSNNYYVKIEMDETGNTNYQPIGTSQLLSVPYALYAGNSPMSDIWLQNGNNIYSPDSAKVGIGTSTPHYKLSMGSTNDKIGFFSDSSHYAYIELYNQLNANMTFSMRNHVAGDFILQGGSVGIGTTNATSKLHVENTSPSLTTTSSSIYNPILTTDNSGYLISQCNLLQPSSSYNFTGFLYGATNRVYAQGGQAGTINSAMGSENDIIHTGSGTITYAYGSSNVVQNSSTATIVNAYGIFSRVRNLGGGSITNGYGIYIPQINATNKWSIYASDATAPSYFAGNIGIGTSNPTCKLDIEGFLRIKDAFTTWKGTTAGGILHWGIYTESTNNAKFGIGLRGLETGSNSGADFFISRYDDAGVFLGFPLFINRSTGNIGIGSGNTNSKITVTGGDVNILDIGSGVIMKSPNGQCWRVTIDNSGNLVRTSIICP